MPNTSTPSTLTKIGDLWIRTENIFSYLEASKFGLGRLRNTNQRLFPNLKKVEHVLLHQAAAWLEAAAALFCSCQHRRGH
jgi:hypothetical protein